MRSRRASLAALALMAALAGAVAQDGDSWGDRFRPGDDEPSELPTLKEVELEDFDSGTASPWRPSLSAVDGIADSQIVPTGGRETGRSLGLKVHFFRRSLSTLDLRPPRPIRIEGRCATVSIRAYGFGFRHELVALVLDYYGVEHELSLGKLDFLGWKRLEASIPLREDGVGSAYVQDDRHFREPAGLRVSGLRIVFDLEESYGDYVAYFDDLGALVDVEGEGETGTREPAGRLDEAAVPEPPPATREAELPRAIPAVAEARALVLAGIERKIAKAMTYPEAARRRGIEGSLVISFRVDTDGGLSFARVSEGSGSELLDRAGLELLRGAFPVENDFGAVLELEIPITFRLDGSARD